MAYTPKTWAEGELITAEDLNALEEGLSQAAALADETAVKADATAAKADETAATVDGIKLANTSTGEGPPVGAAPVGWRYVDLSTGDYYQMEA